MSIARLSRRLAALLPGDAFFLASFVDAHGSEHRRSGRVFGYGLGSGFAS